MGINKNTLRKRAKELLENIWGSTLLFIELPKGEVKPENELYNLEKIETGSGTKYRAIRVRVDQLLSLLNNVRDEGNSQTTYLPSEIHDEMFADTVYLPEETFDGGNAGSLY
jgi:hypothetical protein